jgi:hypothetical protein
MRKEATDQGSHSQRQLATLGREKVAIAVGLALEHPAAAIRPEDMLLPEGVFALVGIGQIAAGAVFEKISEPGVDENPVAIAPGDIDIMSLAAGATDPGAFPAQPALIRFEIKRRPALRQGTTGFDGSL